MLLQTSGSVPLLLNTSFNTKGACYTSLHIHTARHHLLTYLCVIAPGRPLCNRASEALELLDSEAELDAVLIDDYLFLK